MSKRTIAFALAALTPALAANTFTGCYREPPSGFTGKVTLDSLPAGQTCVTHCAGFTYALASVDDCACMDSSPMAGYTEATNDDGSCKAGDFTSTRLGTTFDFVTCYAQDTFATEGDGDSGFYTDLNDCFAACSYNTAMTVRPVASFGQFLCQCTSIVEDGDPGDCAFASNMIFVHQAQYSGQTRRRLRRGARAVGVCPDGMTACTVGNANGDAYECIDTRTELESCGGCTSGTYGNATGAIGVDCSALPGTAFGATTCYQGRCEVFACEEGYQLVDGACQ